MDQQRRQGLIAGLVLALAVAPAAALVAAPPAFAEAARAPRDQGAEKFVQAQGQRLVSILADKSKSAPQRIASFRAAVLEVADVARITRFVLGKYARTITPAQAQRFAAVFQDYALDVYHQRLAHFGADTLTVTGSLALAPGDVVVRTSVGGGDSSQPTEVDWRVRGSGADWKVVDVEVSGVWLAITQQDDFVSTIDNHGGDVGALIARLEQLTQARAAPAPAAGR
jgi:phospholipid transport system substrate-binding protein